MLPSHFIHLHCYLLSFFTDLIQPASQVVCLSLGPLRLDTQHIVVIEGFTHLQ